MSSRPNPHLPMTPTEKKLALIEHINALEEDALEEVYQNLLPEETETEAVSDQDIKSYVLRLEVPAADWVLFELLLEKMRWECEVILRKKKKSLHKLFREWDEDPIEWEEGETVEKLLNDL